MIQQLSQKFWNESKPRKCFTLDFSVCAATGSAALDADLKRQIAASAHKYGLELADCAGFQYSNAYSLLDYIVNSGGYKEIVLLIDEYDAPLKRWPNDQKTFVDLTGYLQAFYGTVKKDSSKLRFIFITGTGSFTPVSVFPRFNNYMDLTTDGDFTALLGFTDAELHQCFDDDVRAAAGQLKLSPEEMYRELKRYCKCLPLSEVDDGVCNSQAVLDALSEPQKYLMRQCCF